MGRGRRSFRKVSNFKKLGIEEKLLERKISSGENQDKGSLKGERHKDLFHLL